MPKNQRITLSCLSALRCMFHLLDYLPYRAGERYDFPAMVHLAANHLLMIELGINPYHYLSNSFPNELSRVFMAGFCITSQSQHLCARSFQLLNLTCLNDASQCRPEILSQTLFIMASWLRNITTIMMALKFSCVSILQDPDFPKSWIAHESRRVSFQYGCRTIFNVTLRSVKELSKEGDVWIGSIVSSPGASTVWIWCLRQVVMESNTSFPRISRKSSSSLWWHPMEARRSCIVPKNAFGSANGSLSVTLTPTWGFSRSMTER